jgi:hypothetical protein
MKKSTAKSQAAKMTMPPTPPSSGAMPAAANAIPSSPTTELHTPRERRSISNRFWDKNASRSKDGSPGVDLASDSSDPDDDSEAARAKQHNNLHSKIKRLLVLETGPLRLAALDSNESVREYSALLDAFAHKPKTKKKRAKYTETLRIFLEDHDQILEPYNAYVKLDRGLRKDRLLPEFVLEEEGSASAKKGGKEEASDVRRAPGKRAMNGDDDSDAEGVVTQRFRSGEAFDEASVFNTRGLTVPSIFNRKTSATAEKNQRRFLLHRRQGSLVKTEKESGEYDESVTWEEEETPTRPGKKRKLA